MDLVDKDIKPRDIVNNDTISNAFALDMAMGGSTEYCTSYSSCIY